MTKKEVELLERHPFKIWQGSGGSWYTYISVDGKRKQLKYNTREKLEKKLLDYYYQYNNETDPTVGELFEIWLSGKRDRQEIEPASVDRYKLQFRQCFQKIEAKKVRELTEYDVERFILNTIHEKQLTVKGYSNMRTLLYGIFRLAKKLKLVDWSISEVVQDADISRKAFRRTVKDDAAEVFSEKELPIVFEWLESDQDVINLGLLLLFKTGLRIGELSALKNEDVDVSRGIIHIHRTEVKYKGEPGRMVYEVRDYPKTDAGVRDVVLPAGSIWILRKIRTMSPFGEYFLERDRERIKAHMYVSRLRHMCKALNIRHRSPHKIRKTYGTILIDSGVDESVIIAQMGHTDISTTKKHYYKNRKDITERADVINHIAGL